MCRWVAYAGPEIYLEDILFNQDHSIVNQSLSAHESVLPLTGMALAWPGTPNARPPAYSRMSCQLGMIVICARWLRISGRHCFLRMSGRRQVQLSAGRTATRLSGKTGRSCTTVRSVIGTTAENTTNQISVKSFTTAEKVRQIVKPSFWWR